MRGAGTAGRGGAAAPLILGPLRRPGLAAGQEDRVNARGICPSRGAGALGAVTGRVRAAAPLWRLLAACGASLVLYALLFGWVLDRPLAYGFLRQQIDMKLARGAAVGSPKLVILAGSNGPYSHRCETIGPIVHLPCVNGGVAVGIGLDYLFARWERHLSPGDTVYLPMEELQYVRSRAATDLGPDASIMFRHDWRTLARLPPDRWVSALFSFDLRYALMAVIETALRAGGFHDPRAAAEGHTNAWGDHTGHTPALGAPYRAVLAHAHPFHATVAEVERGYGTRLILRFLRWARAHGVRTIGGLPTQFIDSPMRPATRRAIRALYLANGATFLELPNRSLYPRADFFDTPYHLSQPWQIVQSVAVGRALRRMLGRGREAGGRGNGTVRPAGGCCAAPSASGGAGTRDRSARLSPDRRAALALLAVPAGVPTRK